MKFNKFVSSSRRKNRKAHFTAPSHIRRKIMSCALSRELRQKYNVRTLPVRRDDEVLVCSGHNKGNVGKVLRVYRKKYVLHIDKMTREKTNGATVYIGVHPSNVTITKLKLDKDRRKIVERKSGGRSSVMEKLKGKHSEGTVLMDTF
ncbi:60S ribosomal protein L26 [Trichinella pseudospiralis]|uniref:60S ribosomal protein L26 n=2 Tax=Trichinella pseudospiralis TaxID=6337 RepID=A0A0V1IYQ4_TRIPS|nr:60S ribosomal protein L26 [Trichinella pseudospiralis]KRZ27851.1 60S ribosomal protein L26 [Trichinella pseudospiralis]